VLVENGERLVLVRRDGVLVKQENIGKVIEDFKVRDYIEKYFGK